MNAPNFSSMTGCRLCGSWDWGWRTVFRTPASPAELRKSIAAAVHRDIAFALAVADLLELPDDLPLMPAVMAAISTPTCLGHAGSRPPESGGAFRRLPAPRKRAMRGAK